MLDDIRLQSIIAGVSGAPAPTASFAGRWRNQLGSEMDLLSAGGLIVGKYRSSVGSTGGLEFDLIGTASADIISFVVNWSSVATHNSITSWVGQLTKDSAGDDVLKTMWLLTTDVTDDRQEDKLLWGSVRAGADDFRRVF